MVLIIFRPQWDWKPWPCFFTDKTLFYLSGYTDSENLRVSSSENPHVKTNNLFTVRKLEFGMRYVVIKLWLLFSLKLQSTLLCVKISSHSSSGFTWKQPTTLLGAKGAGVCNTSKLYITFLSEFLVVKGLPYRFPDWTLSYLCV